MNFIPKIEYIELGTGLPKVVTFDSPPEGDPLGEAYKPSITKTTSNNGRTQVQFNYIKKVYSLEFIFQSEATKDAYVDFYKKHAIRGGKFNYFISSDEVEFEEFELGSKDLELARPIPTATLGEFEYDFKLAIERVESVI